MRHPPQESNCVFVLVDQNPILYHFKAMYTFLWMHKLLWGFFLISFFNILVHPLWNFFELFSFKAFTSSVCDKWHLTLRNVKVSLMNVSVTLWYIKRVVCDGIQYYVTITCNYSDVMSANGRVQHDGAKGNIQRKSNLPPASCLLALEAAMVPCSSIFTQ